MKDRFSEMVNFKMAKTSEDAVNATKQLFQEMILSGLSRGGFFEKAAFNGGTSLRILYDLERFSEDLDFSLMESDPDFTFTKYFPQLKTEFDAMGLNVTFSEKQKTRDTSVKTSYLKGNARELTISVGFDERIVEEFRDGRKITIKFEVDTEPPAGARYERRIQYMPLFYTLTSYDLPTLFAGKVSALLCKAYAMRIKGRDYFDFIWYLKNKIPINLEHVEHRMRRSGCLKEEDDFDLDQLKHMLVERFRKTDYNLAKADVETFLHDVSVLDDWCAEYFIAFTESIRVADYSKALVKENGEHSSFGPSSKSNILPRHNP